MGRTQPRQISTGWVIHAEEIAFSCALLITELFSEAWALACHPAFHRECGSRSWREIIVPEAPLTKHGKPIRGDVLVRRGAMDPKEYGEVKVRHPWSKTGALRFRAAQGVVIPKDVRYSVGGAYLFPGFV